MKDLKVFVGKLELIFSILLTIIFEIGVCLYFERAFTPWRVFLDVFLVVIIAFMLSALNRVIIYLKDNRFNDFLDKKCFKRNHVIFLFLLLAALYFMCYISYYPGIAAYDISNSLYQIKLNYYYNHQPLFYTFLIKFILWICDGNYTRMLIIYSVSQVLFVLFVSFYSLFWLHKNRVHKPLIYTGYFYFLCVPVLHIFSMITTKDVLFSCFFLLFTINFIDLRKNFCKKNVLLFLLNGLFACLMRNNMIYVLILFCVALLLSLKKASRKIVQVSYILIVIFYITQSSFYIFGCGKSPIQETLCVPINQMSYIYVTQGNNLSNGEKEKIALYIPNAKDYNPRCVDPAKRNFNQEEYDKSKSEFWKPYLNLLKKYPFDYIKAFLNINLPYWFIGAKFPDSYSQKAYIETSESWIRSGFKFLERQSYLKPLNEYYQGFADFNNKIMRVFPFSIFFSLSFPFLSLVFCLYIAIKQKIHDSILVYVLYFLLLFTYILGPVSNFRYIYTFYLCLPLYLGIIFRNTKKTEKK